MEVSARNQDRLEKKMMRKTYFVTIIMLLIGQIQVAVFMEIAPIKEFLSKHYYVSLVLFFISFISIQLYVFFYHIIDHKAIWKRILAGIWTFEANTISIMKPARKASYLCLLCSWVLTFLIMGIGAIYGNFAIPHRRGLFISRPNVICWSERIYVLSCFGIIVFSEMKRLIIELPSLILYSLISNIFVVIFGASIRKPNFFRMDRHADYVLIGQLYYLNYFALYMGYVWTAACIIQLIQWDAIF